jgi:hypothetical protein
MSDILAIPAGDVVPDRLSLLRAAGLPEGSEPDARLEDLVGAALQTLCELTEAAGLVAEVSINEFADIYRGEGRNEEKTPVGDIYPQAEQLALFAVTLGRPVSDEISGLFARRDFALGSLLDSAASLAAERAADVLEGRYWLGVRTAATVSPVAVTLRYSPGYCGWDMTGQRALFNALRPAQVGITLRDSCLMEPLKSISGVIIGGPPAIHNHSEDYPFCAACLERGCRARARRLRPDD